MSRPDSAIYRGERLARRTRVWIQTGPKARPTPLDPALHLRAHSPTGFEWGYAGSGPCQLAFAILYDCTDAKFAIAHYQAFKEQHIARIQTANWAISAGDVRRMMGWPRAREQADD